MRSLFLVSLAAALASCSTPTHQLFERGRVPVDEALVPPSVVSAARMALAEQVANPACYAHQVEAAGDVYLVGFYSPSTEVPDRAGPLTVTSGGGHCGQGMFIAVSRRGEVLGQRYSR